MTEVKEHEHETTSRRKKRQRGSNLTSLEKENEISRMQYEEEYAEGYLNKLFKELDETLFAEVLACIVKIENNVCNIKESFKEIETMLKDRQDLQWTLLGFLKPYQALECDKLMSYYEICSMKLFVRNLMFHFKRQPHLLRRMIDKLSDLAESKDLQQNRIEEEIAPLLQKNSLLIQQFSKLLPSEKPPEWYYSTDDMWEDFNIDNDLNEEEILDVPQYNDHTNIEPRNCIYGCKNKNNNNINNNNKISLCPICSVKFINGRVYIANGRILRPANLIFDANEEAENTKRLTRKSDFFTPSVTRTRIHKRADTHKEPTDGNSSPLILGTESEEELGENDPPQQKRRRKNTPRLKIRFGVDEEEKKIDNELGDHNHTDDTAASNDDISCDDTSKEDNENNCCEESILICSSIVDSNSPVCKVKEILNLENIELNISAMMNDGVTIRMKTAETLT